MVMMLELEASPQTLILYSNQVSKNQIMSPVFHFGLKKPRMLELFTLIVSDVLCLLDIVHLSCSSRFRRRHLFPAKMNIYIREREKKKKRSSPYCQGIKSGVYRC